MPETVFPALWQTVDSERNGAVSENGSQDEKYIFEYK